MSKIRRTDKVSCVLHLITWLGMFGLLLPRCLNESVQGFPHRDFLLCASKLSTLNVLRRILLHLLTKIGWWHFVFLIRNYKRTSLFMQNNALHLLCMSIIKHIWIVEYKITPLIKEFDMYTNSIIGCPFTSILCIYIYIDIKIND